MYTVAILYHRGWGWWLSFFTVVSCMPQDEVEYFVLAEFKNPRESLKTLKMLNNKKQETCQCTLCMHDASFRVETKRLPRSSSCQLTPGIFLSLCSSQERKTTRERAIISSCHHVRFLFCKRNFYQNFTSFFSEQQKWQRLIGKHGRKKRKKK